MAKYYYNKYQTLMNRGIKSTNLTDELTYRGSAYIKAGYLPYLKIDAYGKLYQESWGDYSISIISDGVPQQVVLKDRFMPDSGYADSIIYSHRSSSNYVFRIIRHTVETTYTRGAYLANIIAENGMYPINGRHTDGYWYVRGELANDAPTLTDNTENNKTFYEGNIISINGSATDSNNGNVVSIKYKINTGTTKAIATEISDGKTHINYSKTLTYTLGTLKDGDTIVANGLVDGQTYKIIIWAEDDQGGKSTEVVRNFTVVPNRAPVLTINSIENQTNKINLERITISGTVTDADGNDVTVDVKINDSASVRVYSGTPSDFTFDIKIADLVEGENTLTVTSKDTFDFTATKTIKLNKTRNAVPLKTSVARYKISPPAGSASEILAWIQKESGGLTIDADVSMVLSGESEKYNAMNKFVAPINNLFEEKEFSYKATEAKDNITLKLKLSKENTESTTSIKQISGVLG